MPRYTQTIKTGRHFAEDYRAKCVAITRSWREGLEARPPGHWPRCHAQLIGWVDLAVVVTRGRAIIINNIIINHNQRTMLGNEDIAGHRHLSAENIRGKLGNAQPGKGRILGFWGRGRKDNKLDTPNCHVPDLFKKCKLILNIIGHKHTQTQTSK